MAEGVTLEADVPLHAATLRYFDPHGPFAAAATAACEATLPRALTAVAAPRGLLLAWLRPTETLALCEDAARLARLAAELARSPGGHVVDLSGGLKTLRLRGAVGEVMSRLGGTGTLPRAGEARRGRLADVPVLAISPGAGAMLLVVDRAYAPHLLEWVRGILEDLQA